MSPFIRASLLRLVTALAIVSGLLYSTPTAAAFSTTQPVSDPIPGLFAPGDSYLTVPTPQPGAQPALVRQRAARLDGRALDALAASAARGKAPASPLPLALFDDAAYSAVFTRVDVNGPSGYVLNGVLDGIPGSEAALSVQDGVLVGQVNLPGALYRITPGPSGEAIIQQLDPAGFPNEGDVEVPEGALLSDGGEDSPADLAATDDGSRIDVLVVYTPAARAGIGGDAAIRASINLAVSETNTGYANSQVTQRLNLVYAAEVAYDEANYCNKNTGDFWGSTLNCLTGTGDGSMDSVHAMRDAYAADMVVLLVNNTGSCGLSWVMGAPATTGFAPYAFSVVSTNCATGYYSFAHELGHAMGSLHERGNGGGGAYPYSYGYQDPANAFRTIMAYNCPNGGCQRINNWSNPTVSYNGRPTGISETAPNSANNALSLNNTARVVAAFRDGSAPAAPQSLALRMVEGSQAELTWTDTSPDESAFVLERAPAGSSAFAILARLPANTTRYVDPGVTCATAYDYRVAAVSGNGASAYSNVVSSGPSACPPGQPSNLKVLDTAETRVTVTWAAGSGESGYKVERANQGQANWAVVGQTPTGVLTFTDAAAFCETAYDYRVRAFNAAGESPSTQPASAATARCTQPAAPVTVVTQPVCNHSLRVLWQDTPNESRYVIERSAVSDKAKPVWTVVGEVPGNVTAFTDAGLQQGSTYLYRVHAANAAGDAASQPVEGGPYPNAIYLPVVSR